MLLLAAGKQLIKTTKFQLPTVMWCHLNVAVWRWVFRLRSNWPTEVICGVGRSRAETHDRRIHEQRMPRWWMERCTVWPHTHFYLVTLVIYECTTLNAEEQ